MADHRSGRGLPRRAVPMKPSALLLIEDEERLVAELREFRTPAGAALDGPIVENVTDHVDLLAAVHLMPDRLQHFAKQRRVAEFAMHQPAHVGETHVSPLELGLGEGTDAARARVAMAFEGVVLLLDAMSLGGGAERRLGALRGAAEEGAILWGKLLGHGRSLRRAPQRIARGDATLRYNPLQSRPLPEIPRELSSLVAAFAGRELADAARRKRHDEGLDRHLERERTRDVEIGSLVHDELGTADRDRILREHHLAERLDLAIEVLRRAD